MPRKIVLLELNEIPWRIYDEYCRWAPDSDLARVLPKCRQFTTRTEDRTPLSPWFTWPTLHRGVTNEIHGIQYFGEDLTSADAVAPPIWQLLQGAGVKTGVGGPLQSYPMPENATDYAFYLPDTFASGVECHPEELSKFQRFNLAMARQSARNVSTSIDWQTAVQFLASARSLGMRASTAIEIGKQLIAERFESWKRVRRRTYQPVIAFDLYLKQLEKTRPDFSNFFSNHVASAMHRYWAATFPDEYESFEMGDDWVARYRGEIEFSMEWAGRFVSDLVKFVERNPEFVLVVASSMGQAALRADRIETQLYIADLDKFMQAAGLESSDWEQKPSMAPKVSVSVVEPKCAQLESFLRSLEIFGKKVTHTAKEAGFFNIGIGHTNVHERPQFAQKNGEDVAFAELGLGYRKVEDEAGSTAYHIDEGTLFVFDPLDKNVEPGRPEVLTTEIAPTLLSHFGVPIPDYMKSPLPLGALNPISR